ncbi:MAG: ATP-binding protein [Pyrinomonadaceae bacterium]
MCPEILPITPDISSISSSEQALACCGLARAKEEIGDYEAASYMLEQWWQVGGQARIVGISQRAAAEILLRAGTLTGWIGSSRQMPGAQRAAARLISGSITLFDMLGEKELSAEAELELAYCYYREGAFDEARVMLRSALEHISETNTDLRGVALVRYAIVERHSGRLHDALRLLTEAAPLIEESANHFVRGRFHLELATTLTFLGSAEECADYNYQSLAEFAAASLYFEQIGNQSYCANVENNLGFLLVTLNRFDEAHEHLNRAHQLFTNLDDNVRRAQVDDTRARALLAEARTGEAEQLINAAVETLEQSGEQALLAEALTTYGVVLARLGRTAEARPVLERARHIAERIGDIEGAGRAAVTLIEEMCDLLSDEDRLEIAAHADQLLAKSQHAETRARVRACRESVLAAHAAQLKRREQAAQTEKITALGELAYGVAHNVNNALSGILGRAQLLQRSATSTEAREGLETISKAALDAAKTVRRIQDFARQRNGDDFQLIAVDELLMDALEFTRPKWDAPDGQAKVSVSFGKNCCAFVMGDAGELREVLVNMIFNAADAMPAGGQIILGVEAEGGTVSITVRDTGMGMSAEVRSRIFNPYFTTKGMAGTGMGLAVSYGIIRRHEGTIEVESEIGIGTTFRIQLPVAAGTVIAPAASCNNSVQEERSSQSLKILVVDDEEYVRDILHDVLQSEGHQVVVAGSGKEALAAFQDGNFDGVFTDVGMKEMNGWELAQHIRALDPNIPLALVTGWGDSLPKSDHRMDNLIDWIISKPFELTRISEVLGEIEQLRASTRQTVRHVLRTPIMNADDVCH